MAGHYFRPESLLPAKKIQLAAARFLSLLLCDEGLLTIKCVGPAIPLIGNIAVAPKGNQPVYVLRVSSPALATNAERRIARNIVPRTPAAHQPDRRFGFTPLKVSSLRSVCLGGGSTVG